MGGGICVVVVVVGCVVVGIYSRGIDIDVEVECALQDGGVGYRSDGMKGVEEEGLFEGEDYAGREEEEET